MLIQRRRCSALVEQKPEVRAWFAVRIEDEPDNVDLKAGILEPDVAEDGFQAQMEFASSAEAVNEALKIAHKEELWGLWPCVAERLRSVELDGADAVLLLHCMVKMGVHDVGLMRKVVDRIETRYFSMELGLPNNDMLSMFTNAGCFQSLINSLPIDHKVKLILMDDFGRETGVLRPRRSRPEVDVKKRWKTMDPVEMESTEQKRYLEGRIRVARMRDVKARETRMKPGNKLRGILATQLYQILPRASPESLAEISQVCAFNRARLLRGDLQNDFQELLAKRVNKLDTHVVVPRILALTSAMRSFDGSQAMRTWRRKLVPALVQLSKSPSTLEMLDKQRAFHPMLGGTEMLAGPDHSEIVLNESAADMARKAKEAEKQANASTALAAEASAAISKAEEALAAELSAQAAAEEAEAADKEAKPKSEKEKKKAARKAAHARKAAEDEVEFARRAAEAAQADAEAAGAVAVDASEAAVLAKEAAAAATLKAAEDSTSRAASEAPSLRSKRRAERAAQLLVSVCTSRHLTLDTNLFDGLAEPLQIVANEWLNDATDGILLPFETIADVLDACVSAGVGGGALPGTMAKLLVAQFGDDAGADMAEVPSKLSAYTPLDLANAANGIAMLCSREEAEAPLELLWRAAAPKLKTTQPHLVLMLLNAVVRGGKDELLATQAVRDAVDEHLVQQLDYNPATLGRLGT